VTIRARLIANPTAGTDEAAGRLVHLQERLAADHALDTVLTRGAGDAREAAADAARAGYARVFVAGGDGTLNEVVNGVASIDGALPHVVIGVLPAGTGNDFATALGIPRDLDAALDALTAGVVREIDLGEVNGRLFANVSAGGFLADVSEAVDPALKDIAGRLAYLLGGAKVLLNAQPFRCTAAGSERACLLFAVCNAPMIGGGRPIAPSAAMDDGLLDVCIAGDMELPQFVGLLRQVASGTHIDHPGVEYFTVAQMEMRFDRSIRVNADGEVFEAERCEYRVHPRAARFLAPAAGA
jgi:diacylglycerol kinase (ATP)